VADTDGRGASDEEVSTVDQKFDRLADKLQELANRSAAEGGAKAKLAQPLAEDAAFLRKLKPSLIKARARGKAIATTGGVPKPDGAPTPGRVAPSRPPRRRKPSGGRGGPNPLLVAGVCFVAGVALAKWIDWRGHAHPRD
jgi:hypothetical protein